MQSINQFINDNYKIDQRLIDMANEIEDSLKDRFEAITKTADYNQLKVLNALQKNRLSDMHFSGTTGYGYNDTGRSLVEKVYADIFNAEDGLMRIQMISGTHALTCAICGNLFPGDELLMPTGKPYDTLFKVIGLKDERGSLADYGITNKVVDVLEDNSFDYESIKKSINENTKMAAIQRSKGYDFRRAYTVEEIGELIKFIKSIKPDIICMVDNCYGEFTQEIEPTDMGADLAAGSLIKNIGGGLAPAGGYVVGKKKYVQNSSYRLFSPALGKGAGASLGFTPTFLQGLFLAPQVVGGCLKGTLLSASMFERLGFEVAPSSKDVQPDIVNAIKMGSEDKVKAFCVGVQKASPVDGFVTPIPGPMPGYDCDIIMAAGAFIQGSSIELSADAPIREPYYVYFQGGLSYLHSKMGTLCGIQEMIDRGLLSI